MKAVIQSVKQRLRDFQTAKAGLSLIRAESAFFNNAADDITFLLNEISTLTDLIKDIRDCETCELGPGKCVECSDALETDLGE